MVRCSGTEADGVAFLMRSGDIITQKSILHILKYRTNACIFTAGADVDT